jgi:hypothetical protein
MATMNGKVLSLPYRPNSGTKFTIKRDAEAVARFLAGHGHQVEWVRRNYGAQRQLTWNVRLADGSEIHSRYGLEGMGFKVRYTGADPADRKRFYGAPDYGVSVRSSAGRWTVLVAWTERGRPASINCGHQHRSHEAGRRCAATWRRRVAGEVDGPAT